jgi:hypothetical protein
VSYSIQLDVKDNEVTVAGLAGGIPDGQYVINGHESPTERSITVRRSEPGGTGAPMVVQSTGWASRIDLPQG